MDDRRDIRPAPAAIPAPLTGLRALLIALGGLLALSACAPTVTIAGFADLPPGVELEDILVVTSRKPVDNGALFGRERGSGLVYGSFGVSVPPDREPGRISWPRGTPDPMRHFTFASADTCADEAEFVNRLNRRLSQLDEDERIIVIFVHGYNETFGSALFRFAQMMHDFRIPGVPVHFSWASAGDPRYYAYDLDSVFIARDGFSDLLELAAGAQADRIMIIAHSMGSMLTMETLRELAVSEEDHVLSMIGPVALMSPDVSIDVFRSQLGSLRDSGIDFVVFTSARDRALRASALLRGQTDRLGSLRSIEEVSDLRLTVIDVSGFATSDPLRHSTLAMSPALIALFGGTRDFGLVETPGTDGIRGPLSFTINFVRQATEIVLTPAAAAADAIEGGPGRRARQ
ncbi:MAG: alpha/beta fold hydrolase [Oceanicaulis sp.]|uniref:alpha/beta hydrolase n=1 Tax=Glycocaulis sp. TaxID=1969725 RepID=UPI0025BA4A83|nr:alpha/beta fold hydrolase [Glycocaulis sp.]MCC5981537.1 alpha/beta fold hydrolase [Oceanicaulis sp.]MCH8520763.1 alpha/beta fold hydrolase [Glycocaulis sp.]